MTDQPRLVEVTYTLKAITGALESLTEAFEAHVEAVRELAGQAPEADAEAERDHCLDNPLLTAKIGPPIRCPHCNTTVPPTHWAKHIQRHHPAEPSGPTQCSGEEGFCPEHGFHRHSLKQPAAGYCPHCGRGDAGPDPEALEPPAGYVDPNPTIPSIDATA